MKLKLSITLIVVPAFLLGLRYHAALGDWFGNLLWPAEAEPVPLLQLIRKPYQVKVSSDGRLTGLVTTGVNTPQGRGSLKIAWLVEEGAVVKKGDLLVRFDNTDAQLALEQNENEVSTLRSRIEKTEIDRLGTLERLSRDKQSAEINFDYARNQIRQDATIFSKWKIAESIVSAELAQSRLMHVEEQTDLHETLSRADTQILEIERETAQSEVEQAKSTLASLEVRAPVAGVILYKHTWRKLEVGGEVWPEQPLMEIATQNQLRGELNVVETAVAGVSVDNPVHVSLPALPGNAFEGVVTSVAQIADQLDREDPRRYFTCQVTIEIPVEFLPKLKPGMQLRGEIVVADYKAAIVLPRSAVFKEDGLFKVFVKQNNEFADRKIKIENADHGFYVVTGLEEGDQICLRHPFGKEKLHLPDFSTPAGPSGGRGITIFFN